MRRQKDKRVCFEPFVRLVAILGIVMLVLVIIILTPFGLLMPKRLKRLRGILHVVLEVFMGLITRVFGLVIGFGPTSTQVFQDVDEASSTSGGNPDDQEKQE